MAKKSSCSSSSSSSFSQNPKQQHEKPSSSAKKQTRKRFFTLNDEILILNSLFDFKSYLGQHTMIGYTAFYNSVKSLLSVKPTQDQLRKRIWKLKRKYENMKKKENQKFPTALEKKIFDISHMIWEEKKENAARKKESANTNKMSFFSMREILQKEMKSIGESDRVELDRMLKELKVQEMELALKRAQLVMDSADAISKALKGSSSS